MDRTVIAYTNYLKHQIYINGIDTESKNAYAGKSYDITADIQAIKNYLGIDSSLQRNAFESYSDLTDYYLIIDDSQFIKDNTNLIVTDIYFMDGTVRYDNSICLFSKSDIISNYSKLDSSAVLHFKFLINKYPDITENLSFSFPIFISPNMSQIANDLILQYDINFISMNFFTEHSLLMNFKSYIETEYVTSLNSKLSLNFTGQNNIYLVDYRDMFNSMILDNLSKSFGREQRSVSNDTIKQYIHDSTTIIKILKFVDTNKIIDLFTNEIEDFYTNHVDQTIDPYAGFSTDRDLYSLAQSKSVLVQEGTNFYDKLNINFISFLLIRNNIYNQKFTLLHDGSEFQSDYIKFKVMNIIPNWTYDFSFNSSGYDTYITSIHNTNIPLKIDILEYSNNLIWSSSVSYSNFINNYYYSDFTLQFTGNKLETNYGFNTIRIFLSDSLSEEYKDIKYTFVYAPYDIISKYIAKISFVSEYENVANTQSVDKLLPLSDDYTSYSDLSAMFDGDATNSWMYIQIPVDYQLIYSKNVPITCELITSDGTTLLSPFMYLDQDSTKYDLNLSPTLTVTSTSVNGATFMLMYRYRFSYSQVYTDEVIQKMNGILNIKIYPTDMDATDSNYFCEYIQCQFITTRFKIRVSSHTSIAAQSYSDKDVVSIVPQFSTTSIFGVQNSIDYMNHYNQSVGFCNFQMWVNASSFATKKINRTSTIKLVPVIIDVLGGYGYKVCDAKSINETDATKFIDQVSPQIGYVKEINNFAYDMIYRDVLNKFNIQIVSIFNEYMSNVESDIVLTYRTDYDRCTISVGYRSEFMNSLLNSTGNDGWTIIKYVFDTYGLDHTSSNAYNNTDISTARNKYSVSGVESAAQVMTSYSLNSNFASQIDVKFATSGTYSLYSFFALIKEAFVKKYHSDKMPLAWKYTKLGTNGESIDGHYTYGDQFRTSYFGGSDLYLNSEEALYTFVKDTGLHNNLNYITDYYMNNISIDYSTSDDSISLTGNQVIDLYFTNSLDREALRQIIYNNLWSQLKETFSYTIKVKKVYSADLTATLSQISDDVFTIYIEPTDIAPLYSSFIITNIKYVYDSNVVTLTELYDLKSYTSNRTYVTDILGTGMEFQCKYLNHSLSGVNMAVLIYYNDEYGYEKTISVEFTLRSKLQTSSESETSVVVTAGVNILKAIQLLSVFDENNAVITSAEEALTDIITYTKNGDGNSASKCANTYQGSVFTAKDLYYTTLKKYLNTTVLDSFYYQYVENRLYGRPTFSFSSGVSLFVLPENTELIQSTTQKLYLDEAIGNFVDSSYKANQSQGDNLINSDYLPCIDYKEISDSYYSNFVDRNGYDINLILLPDTTYNISLKTYLVFNYTLKAGQSAMSCLSGFLSDIGGGNEVDCMINLKEFLTMARMYSNIEDLVRGILKDLYISLNFESYGRVPSAMSAINISDYYANQYQTDYNTFIESGSFYYAEFEKSSKAQFGFVIPFEKLLLNIDSTATGIYKVNFIEFSSSTQKTEFVDTLETMLYANTKVSHWKDNILVNITTPSVIPTKNIDVIVKALF